MTTVQGASDLQPIRTLDCSSIYYCFGVAVIILRLTRVLYGHPLHLHNYLYGYGEVMVVLGGPSRHWASTVSCRTETQPETFEVPRFSSPPREEHAKMRKSGQGQVQYRGHLEGRSRVTYLASSSGISKRLPNGHDRCVLRHLISWLWEQGGLTS